MGDTTTFDSSQSDSEVQSDSSDITTVGLFVTCLVDLCRPSIGFSTAELLQHSGYEVAVPLQTCCGQPALNSGDQETARRSAMQLVETFDAYQYIVVPSGSCASIIKNHYPTLFQESSDWLSRVQELAHKTYELTEFLVDVVGLEKLKVQTTSSYQSMTYHDSCSGLRECGIRSQPRKLLQHCTDMIIEESTNSEICCGFGGAFCVKFPEISTEMADKKIAGLKQSNTQLVAGGDLGCLLHLAGRLNRQKNEMDVFHIAEVLTGNLKSPIVKD